MWNWQQTDWPNWTFESAEMAAMEAQFLLGAGRLQGVWQHLSGSDREALRVDFLSDEAMKTSAIEGEFLDRYSVQSSVRLQLGLSADRRAGPAESGIAALQVACYRDFAEALSDAVLFDWQAMICRGRNDLGKLGAYRDHGEAMQVISGPYQKPVIHFEAPPSDQMAAEMAGFVTWFNARGAMPALTRAGLAHLYFVSVHPFEDGNGRVARSLSEKALAQALGSPSLVAISRQIEKTRPAYYDALERNNKALEVTDWLVWFGETVLAAQAYSLVLIDHLIAKSRLFDRLKGQLNVRQTKVMVRIFDAGPEGFIGGLSAKNYMSITGTPPATARRDLVDLVGKSALRRTGERKGTRYWLV